MNMLGMILTLIKPINTFLIGLFLWSNHPYLAALWVMVLMICDIADGVVFRRSSWAVSPPEWWKTKFGIEDFGWFRRICDIVGDRLAVEVCIILTILWYDFPTKLYAVELIRDLLLLITWAYGKYMRDLTITNPNLMSRISMFGVGMMGIFWLLDMPGLAFHTVWIVIFCGCFGGAGYWLLLFIKRDTKFNWLADGVEMIIPLLYTFAASIGFIWFLVTIFGDYETATWVGMGIAAVLISANLFFLWCLDRERYPRIVKRFPRLASYIKVTENGHPN